MRYLAFTLALLCLPVRADYIANNGRDSVRITDAPCPAEVLKLLPEGARGYYRAAFAQVDGTSYAACWTLATQQRVHLKYPDGDEGLIPVSEFKDSPGV
jgi:hypothetical protein